MNFEFLLCTVEDKIGRIWFNRPDRLNTFNSGMAKEFNQALHLLDSQEDVQVIIVQGQGKAFCAGIDVSELEDKSSLDYYFWVKQMEEMSLTIAGMQTPVIAAVQDLAVANGIGVVASADLAIAAEGARFGATAVNVGLFCMGPAVPLVRNVGPKKALELLLTGEMIDAQEAWRIGLINRVVAKKELESQVLDLAKKICAKSPLAVGLGKRSFYAMLDLEYAKAFELVNNHFALLCSTADAKEGVKAFLEKRKPEWTLK